MISSVPQGTVLGPILFLIRIGDINNKTSNHVSSFADYTRVLLASRNKDDVQKLQNNLKTIYKWQQINNMQFNENKFELLQYGKHQDKTFHLILLTKQQNHLANPMCQRCCCQNKWHPQFHWPYRDSMYQSSANMRVDHKNLPCRDMYTMKTLWCSIVQTHTAPSYGHHTELEISRQLSPSADHFPVRYT